MDVELFQNQFFGLFGHQEFHAKLKLNIDLKIFHQDVEKSQLSPSWIKSTCICGGNYRRFSVQNIKGKLCLFFFNENIGKLMQDLIMTICSFENSFTRSKIFRLKSAWRTVQTMRNLTQKLKRWILSTEMKKTSTHLYQCIIFGKHHHAGNQTSSYEEYWAWVLRRINLKRICWNVRNLRSLMRGSDRELFQVHLWMQM